MKTSFVKKGPEQFGGFGWGNDTRMDRHCWLWDGDVGTKRLRDSGSRNKDRERSPEFKIEKSESRIKGPTEDRIESAKSTRA